jgi:acetyl esterase/lipase
MRPLESVQLVVVAGAVLLPAVMGRRLRRGRTAAFLLGSMVLQLVVEGFRWQLIPLDSATLGLAVGDVVADERRLDLGHRIRRGVLGGVGVASLAVLPVLLPVPELPPPGGPYPVGTVSLLLVDDRPDPFVQVEEGVEPPPRRIPVQVWYPAETVDGQPEPWADVEFLGPALAERIGVPSFFLGHLSGVPSHSYRDAVPMSGRFPVLLYVHGWGGFRTIALDQIETLASNGYVVVAADHVPAAAAARFPDGTVSELDPGLLPDPGEVGEDAYREAAERLVEGFADDLTTIVDHLAEGPSGPFGSTAAQVDLEALGVWGHSTGGGAAVWFCLVDRRCDAVAGLDPWIEPIPGRVLAEELRVPSLFIRSDDWSDTRNDRLLRGLAERSPSVSWWIGISGAAHSDLVATPLLTPHGNLLGLKGPVPSDKVVRLLHGYLVSFFDQQLYGEGGAVLGFPPPPGVAKEMLP